MNILELTKKGLHEVGHTAYHASPGVSKTGLVQFAKSPAHFQAYLRQGQPETPAMRFGRIVHRFVLEPDDCAVVLEPKDINKRTKAGKEEYAAFLQENEGCEIVTPDEADILMEIRDACYNHPAARALLFADGQAELSGWWWDQDSDELCRCRPDYFRKDQIIVDLKTAIDASPRAFGRASAKYLYHVQDAFYSAGTWSCTGEPVRAFVFVVVEKTPPYAVAVYTLPASAKESGRLWYKKRLVGLAECRERDEWSAYSMEIETLEFPEYALEEEVL